MVDYKPFRSRRVVDYSKFIGDDSDSDDFVLPNAKKNKTSKSVIPASSDHKSSPKTVSKPDLSSATIKKPAGEDSKIITPACTLKLETSEVPKSSVNVKPESKIKVSDSEQSSDTTNSDSQQSSTEEVESDNSVTKPRSKIADNVCTKKTSKLKTEECSRLSTTAKNVNKVASSCKNDVQVGNRQKWRPPGNANSAGVETKANSTSPGSSGLRLGLSRNARTKPLHANVKMQ